ncbi:hypothetical protein B6U99_00740 [Candidatus Geothermarchaeota archaeon ex4572_27]|nr:MAG: hypothetical protein B6U99_00740 [Candidatus Geothermarchaeota archaeon ex4572_27]
MPKIRDVSGRVVYNSRGEETIEVTVSVEGGVGRYAAPAGMSVGSQEVPPYPKGGLSEALSLLKGEIRGKLVGFSYESQEEIDSYVREIDGTGNYSRIGSVLSLGISVAAAEAAANSLGIPLYHWLGGEDTNYLPVPLGNVVGGGKHARGLSIDIQEVLVFPVNARSVREAVSAMIEIHRRVGEILARRDRFFTAGRNDEGAWTTTLSEEDVFSIVWEAIDAVRSERGVKFALGVDMAASSLWDRSLNLYVYGRAGVSRDRSEQIEYVISLIREHNLSYVEDPLNDQDFPGFSEITRRVGNVIVAGDDLYATNPSRLILGVSERAGNGVIIKPNQVGDLSRSRQAVDVAKRGGFKIIVSHRSGETMYPHLASIAVAFKAELIKCGVMGGERIDKLNHLIKIEEEVGGEVRPVTFAF